MAKIKDYVKRMLVEYDELDTRITKLDNFVNSDKFTDTFDEKGMESANLLVLQLDTMQHYRMILRLRLYNEGIPNPEEYLNRTERR